MQKIILTCTTFFRDGFSIEDFIENFKTLFLIDVAFSEKLSSLVIINEYSPRNLLKFEDNQKLIATYFPSAVFIQKHATQFGQARSLNMIMDLCKGFDVPIQWEEGWICNEDFLDDTLILLENSTYH